VVEPDSRFYKLYPGGSNITEAIAFGRIAGENAAEEDDNCLSLQHNNRGMRYVCYHHICIGSAPLTSAAIIAIIGFRVASKAHIHPLLVSIAATFDGCRAYIPYVLSGSFFESTVVSMGYAEFHCCGNCQFLIEEFLNMGVDICQFPIPNESILKDKERFGIVSLLPMAGIGTVRLPYRATQKELSGNRLERLPILMEKTVVLYFGMAL